MLWAVYKSNLISSVKGHAPCLFAASNAAVARWTAVRCSETCGRSTLINTAKAERTWLQTVKPPLPLHGQPPSKKKHFTDIRQRDGRPTTAGLCARWKGHSAATASLAFQPKLGAISCQTRGTITHNSRLKGCWGDRTHYSQCSLPSTRGLLVHEGAKPGRPALLRGCRGYSSAGPEEPVGRGQKVSSEDKCEEDPPPPGTGDTPRPEGLSHFKELYENPWTIPNLLCIARIGLSPVLGYLIVEEDFHLSLGLFVLAGVTDLLDGYIARNWANQKSALGSALDPLADKILISVLYISLTYAHLIPIPLTALVISRDVALIAAVFYVRYKTVPPPRTLSRFFNPCYATAQLKPTFISKVNTAVQLVLVAASLAAPVFQYVDSILLQSLWYITGLTTTASAYSYYHYGKKTVQVLNNTK
ncbi:cardiolipin synthase (CMP-forming) [Amia ocellicauda]|uniref:cardiolipin synthase (CMP-forming) n=1 Tax=Amia ocellicauda TaxID=2972642 RepID=UPI0034638DB7